MNKQLNAFKDVITDVAFKYVAKLEGGANAQELLKCNKAIEQNLVTARNFEDAELNFRSFNWHIPDRDRNWWWQMQALPFLGWFNASYTLLSYEQQQKAINFCLESIRNWQQQAATGDTSPLVWHDHATAFRLRNIVNWLVICFQNGHLAQLQQADSEIQFMPMIEQHLIWLADDNNYSKHTNHGFDQALVVYSIAMYRSDSVWQQHSEQASCRLLDELSFAFTEEGVHKENSPGYHKFMLGRVKTLLGLRLLGETVVSIPAEQYIDKATAFLKAITLPNGFLPMIGDTRGSEAGLKTEITEDLKVYDYSKSGYVIVKGRDNKNKEFCLIFKNAHDSHYHRHDDDLSLYLYYDGEVLLGDGGLGSHNEKDPRRIFLRSAKSHNAPYIDGVVAVRNPKKLLQKNVTGVSEGNIIATSYCYGFEITRKINFENICAGLIVVEDTFPSNPGNSNVVNFYSELLPFESDNEFVFCIKEDVKFSISMPDIENKDVYIFNDSFVSLAYNGFSQAISFGFSSVELSSLCKIKFI